MSNNLEKFIRENRSAFNDEAVPGNVWENIEAGLTAQPKKRSPLRAIYKWSMAAAAVLVIGAAFYFGLNTKEGVRPETADSIITGLSPEHASEVYQFVKLIDTKQEELKKLTREQPELYREFSTAIDQLDSSYNTLKNQLSSTPNTEMLLEAMIQNLELQLSVLNQQLSIINQIKESKKVSHAKTDKII
jgi:septal ring factor EnvC (AmiA/AmiB activator)